MATREKEQDMTLVELLETLIGQADEINRQMRALTKRVDDVAKFCGYTATIADE